eukprot:TRINITY_DN10889_c0_g1_i1.p1 TRINITY_DN10889_c0_g1~~TRINITY_DN10889_c0_g1_i1.p1  ORF type:complete len:206 (-),score=28.32 TRINITY_DN10889_c0_g1_i1:340-957(-)
MRRRLSVAIALVGNPKIVFLDEPSTGLDPDNRQKLWKVLEKCRGKRAIFLTTHSMEEADVLCSKIGILINGQLRCFAPPQRLKSLYGCGYHLYINCFKEKYFEKSGNQQNQNPDQQNTGYSYEDLANENYQKTKDMIKQILPQSTLVNDVNGNFIYQIPLKGLVISTLFDQLEECKTQYKIQTWGISQSTLEDVFMELISKYDKP